MNVRFTNYNAFAAALAGLPETLTQTVMRATEEACITVQAKAQELCPKEHGELVQSISYNPPTVRGGKVQGIVGSNLNYALYVHEGTGIYSRTGKGRKEVPWTYYDESDKSFHTTDGIRPTPFLEEARERCRTRINEIFSAVIGMELGG